MFICYIDESGDTGSFIPEMPNSQPLLVLSGVFLPQGEVAQVTSEFIGLKRRYFPNRGNCLDGRWHSWLRLEIKGAELRRNVREGDRDERRHALRVMDGAAGILERHGANLLARVYVKQPHSEFRGADVYAAAVQHIVDDFQHFLGERGQRGIVILDSRTKNKNVPVAHSVFTKNFAAGGPRFGQLAELPLFGHSDNHALLQLTDWISSSFLFPCAALSYCGQYTGLCLHVSEEYESVRSLFGQRLKGMQYRYTVSGGMKRGGVNVLGGSVRLGTVPIFGECGSAPDAVRGCGGRNTETKNPES